MARSKKKTEDIMEQIAEQIVEPDLGSTDLVSDDQIIDEMDEGDIEEMIIAEEIAVVEEAVSIEETALEEELIMTLEDVRLVEAILFASPTAVSIGQIAERFPEARVKLIPDVLEHLRETYANRGVTLVQRENKWALRTAADLGDQIRLEKEQPKKFTRAAMETMAIVAYHQPVTRAEIENIRGVATSPGALDALMEAGWIKPGKRREVPGRPVTWLTTQSFLDHFGLEKIEDLPGMEELKAAGLLDKRPAIEAMPTPDLFDGKEEDDPQTVTDEDLIGDSGIESEEDETVITEMSAAEDGSIEDIETVSSMSEENSDEDDVDDEDSDEDDFDDEDSDDEENEDDDLEDEDSDDEDLDEESDEDFDEEDSDDASDDDFDEDSDEEKQ